MDNRWNVGNILIWITVFILGGYVLVSGGGRILKEWRIQINQMIQDRTESLYMPGLKYESGQDKMDAGQRIVKRAMQMIPLGAYVEGSAVYEARTEDMTTYEMIMELQAKEENEVDENGKLMNGADDAAKQIESAQAESIDTSIEKLRDFDYLLSNFYTVDSTTSIDGNQLNADALLGKSMKINRETKGPKVLIFHTHSQELFADSVEGDANTSIVGVGAYLAEQLNARGIETLHHPGVYDIINGSLDRSAAYEQAEVGVRQILADNPSIEVVIDLHRDGVPEGTHLVTEINGKPTAKIMFFNGLSRTKENGDIPYLVNPYIQDNLAFSLQMQLASERKYPGFTRRIYLRGYRYSLHMMPKSLLIEAGAQTNTVEEMKNAMEVLADTLQEVLTE